MTPQNDAQLRNALLGLAADISAHHHPQPATSLFLRAQLRERHRINRRATALAMLPLRIMQTVGIIAAVLVTAFTVHQSQLPAPGVSQILWISAAAILLLVGCGTLFLAGRTPDRTIRPSHAPLH